MPRLSAALPGKSTDLENIGHEQLSTLPDMRTYTHPGPLDEEVDQAPHRMVEIGQP